MAGFREARYSRRGGWIEETDFLMVEVEPSDENDLRPTLRAFGVELKTGSLDRELHE